MGDQGLGVGDDDVHLSEEIDVLILNVFVLIV